MTMDTIPMRRNFSADRTRQAPSFPSRTNPMRPPAAPGSASAPMPRRGEACYPAKCNPNPPKPPLSDPQRELAARYVPLARSMAQGFAKSWPAGGDDYRATACLALVEAAQSFDESKGVDFATFARHRIRGALINAQRGFFSDGWRGSAEFAPKFQPLAPDSEVRGRVVGTHPDQPVGARLEEQDSLEHCLRRLPSRHAAAFRHIYLDGKTQEEAAELLGCSKASMCRLHRETLDRIDQTREGGRRVVKPRERRRLLVAI
ncbi:sigma-70 family RNA polymerase sigma factor [Paludisphaera mucosa]|uniref:Sigma-70 family RNA polymerase sigma factor n=1 Tax=Paludisphaera mucosa TaxID=3030827 RepID=A0ABT6F751_9BACT|nr:sigma-70 family RNA polymerase sigma factor [Paludisphaera mucosa]MDG3003406.1 sigma-70 family RNA polymerase sigma factor [Paludisphaera mucosa]